MAKKVEVTELKREKTPELKAVHNGDDVMNLKDKKECKFRGLRAGEKSA